jgi:hypothetical protein
LKSTFGPQASNNASSLLFVLLWIFCLLYESNIFPIENLSDCIIFFIVHEYTLLYFIFFKISMHGKVYNFKVSSLMAWYIWTPFLSLFSLSRQHLLPYFPNLKRFYYAFSIYCYFTLLKCNKLTRISLAILEKNNSYH